MNKWLGPGANKITLGRVPCLVFVFVGVFYRGRDDLGWFWVGGIGMIVGMFLDWLDGFWARTMAKATKEGQFLDQLVDKLFVWPIWIACGVVHWSDLAWYWYLCSAWLLALDIVSCRKHYANYLADCAKGPDYFDKSHGAVWQGKWKFACENIVNCVLVSGLCPVPAGGGNEWWQVISSVIGDGGRSGYRISIVFVLIALVLANWSILKRNMISSLEKIRLGP